MAHVDGRLVPELASADVCDAVPFARLIDHDFRDFGGRRDFHGPARTLKTLDDNTKVRSELEQPGEGRVLVIDGAGSRKAALVGGNLAMLAEQNGWAGILIKGCVRDTHELASCQVGIKALGTCPKKSRKSDGGDLGVTLAIGGVSIREGDYITADRDGVVITDDKPEL